MKQEEVKAGLYVRSGTKVTPGIMTLGGGVLSFRTSTETLFESPVANVQVDFSRYSTLTVHTTGKKFVFVTGAYAGSLAPRFSDQQLTEIAKVVDPTELSRTFKAGATILVSSAIIGNVSKVMDSFAGRGIGIVGRLVGVISITRSQAQSFAIARAWAEYLQTQGVPVRLRGTTFAASQKFLAMIIVPSLIVFGLLVYIVLMSF